MAKYQECEFDNSTEVLDGNEYISCKFKNSRIVITRGNYTLDNCSFDSCKFEFGGEAANIRNIVLSLIDQPQSAETKPQGSKTQSEASKHE